jgi:hypothetical protein
MMHASAACGCCEGVQVVTPQPTANRPGLSTLAYRVGTHATFLETMQARLSSQDYLQLAALKTRDLDDLTMALLDGWATVADVLTFYQERIANEGYLRTATERRSILALAQLVGYALRPGVSASVYLAYTLDDNSDPVEIPAGARVQSIPNPGELPQSFETSERLKARAAWNNLKPRITQPQHISPRNDGIDKDTIYFDGTATNLKANDLLLFVFDRSTKVVRHVKTVETQFADNRTKVTLQEPPSSDVSDTRATISSGGNGGENGDKLTPLTVLQALAKPLSRSPSLQPANSLRLSRSASEAFEVHRDTLPQLLTAFQPRIANMAYRAWANATVTPSSTVEVYALRVKAGVFGDTTREKTLRIDPETGQITRTGEWPIVENSGGNGGLISHEQPSIVYLDGDYDKVVPDTWVVVNTGAVEDNDSLVHVKPVAQVTICKAKAVRAGMSRAKYGITSKTTQITLSDPWIKIDLSDSDIGSDDLQKQADAEFQIIRRTVVYTQSELLPLAQEPWQSDAKGNPSDIQGSQIQLDTLYDGLQSGRWVIISGERTDIPHTTGVKASELVMLAGVTQGFNLKLPGDTVHTTLILANQGLKYTYKRDTVTIYGNVVKATHGETRNEVLGSGDAGKALASFTLKQPPLTYVSAPNPAGVDSTLHVRVNTVEWHETDTLAGLGPNDRYFITRTDDDAKTAIVFGNGEHGARLPTGVENITSVYRNGIGKNGNVKAEQVSLLATRPLGVKGVINPIRASGGANKESRDQARRNTPLAVMALDRLVSTDDYAAFARTFGGIGKASAARLSDGHRQLVHLTIAGADDIPIDTTSDLYHNLRRALRDYGDPYLFIDVAVRELLALIISAKVRVLPDYQWESVARDIRTALLDAFSFERRELGQSVFLSEVISLIQRVIGVAYVDVDVLDSLSETEIADAELLKTKFVKPEDSIRTELARVNPQYNPEVSPLRILPAQLAYLMPDVPDTLILNPLDEVKP